MIFKDFTERIESGSNGTDLSEFVLVEEVSLHWWSVVSICIYAWIELGTKCGRPTLVKMW